MPLHKFIIVAQPYSVRSGGVMVLHDLCEALNRNGYQAGIVFMHGGNATEQNFQYALSNDAALYRENGNYHYYIDETEARDVFENGTVIYPDLILGNPLGAKKTVRYILNFNSLSFSGDFVLSYSKIFSKYSNFVLTKPFHHSCFTDAGTLPWSKRTLDLTYIGKGAGFVDCHRIKNTILIERDYPRDKEQLALLLRQCRFFYTWDCVSATNFDAVMCGAIPILLHDKQIDRNIINKMELGAFPTNSFTSIQDLPDGLQFDEQQIDGDVMAFKNSYFHLINSWDKSVKLFAEYYLDLVSSSTSFERLAPVA
jgi:hypothetical protein